MAADSITEEYDRDFAEGKTYRGVYGLTSPRNKVYGYDEHGQRKEVVPITEVAGLQLEEYKFKCLQDMLEANKIILETVRKSIESIRSAVATDVTENQIEAIITDLKDNVSKISKQQLVMDDQFDKYKKESIDIKDYPNFL